MTTYDVHKDYWLKKAKISPRFLGLVLNALCPRDRIVDIGCGNGRLAKALREHVSDVSGIDFSEKLLEAAKKYDAGVTFYLGNAETSELWDQIPAVDVAVSNVAIRKDGCRLERLLPHLRNCKKILFKIQGSDDLPEWVSNPPFYSFQEIKAILEPYFQLQIEVESYEQGFSDLDYVRLFMQRIGITPNEETFASQLKGTRLYIRRNYLLVSGRKNKDENSAGF